MASTFILMFCNTYVDRDRFRTKDTLIILTTEERLKLYRLTLVPEYRVRAA